MTISPRAMQRQNKFPSDKGVPASAVSISNTVSVTFSGAAAGFQAFGFATSATPSYTNSTTQSLSLNLAGDLRTAVSNTVSVTFSGTINTTGTFNASGFATSATPSYTDSTTQALSLNLSGQLRVAPPNPTTVSGTVSAQFLAASTGGFTPSTSTALTSASFTITTSAATLGGYFIGNPNTGSFAYVQIFDAATVTVGTTAPVVVLPIPAGGGANLQPLIAFANSIKAAATTTPTGSASLTSSLVASFWYK